MISLIFLLSALALGAAVTRRLGLRLLAFEGPALSIVLGFVLWTWMSFLLALLLPSAYSLTLTVLIAAAATVWLWRLSPAWKLTPLPGGRLAWTVWGAFTALTLLLIAPLMWSHYLPQSADGIYSATATWADFGVHASLVSHFAAASRLPLDFPVAAGTHLTYPFMVDLLSGWLRYGGWSLHAAFLVPSLLLVAAFLQLMLGFGVRLFGGLAGAAIGLILALFSGSAVGLFTALSDYSSLGLPLGEFLQHLPKDYTVLSVPNAQVISFLADIILPQRSFLMGSAVFAAVLVIFAALRARPNRPLTYFVGALIGLVPLIHAHTFIVLGAVTAAFWLEDYLRTHRLRNSWLTVGLIAVAVALPQLAWQALANGTGSGGHWSPGWLINPGETLISFWMHNFGLMGLIIFGIGAILALEPHLRRYLSWYLPLIIVFIVANIYSFQAFAFDNGKLIMYVYLMADIFAGYGAVWLVRRSRVTILPLLVVAVLLCSSGALAVTREFQHHDQFASPDDIALAGWVASSTAPSDIFMTTDRPNQPIPTLAGRPIVAGYRGWLYSYNFPYQPRLDAIAQALAGHAPSPAPYGAKYLAVSSYEPVEWHVDPAALDGAYAKVYSNPSWTVYRLP